MKTPMTLLAERFDLTPTNSAIDSGMFDFDELEVRSPSVENLEVPIDYRGEDAHEIFRLAELKIFQENVRRIEDDIAAEDDDDDIGRNDRDIMSKKFFEPKAFTKSSGLFHQWAEDFVDFIAMRDEELATALQIAMETLTPIVSSGENQRQAAKATK